MTSSTSFRSSMGEWDCDCVVDEILHREFNTIRDRLTKIIRNYVGSTIEYNGTIYTITTNSDFLNMPLDLIFSMLGSTTLPARAIY